MVPTTLCVLFTALRSLGAGVTGEKLLFCKSEIMELWNISKHKPVVVEEEAEDILYVVDLWFSFQTKF